MPFNKLKIAMISAAAFATTLAVAQPVPSAPVSPTAPKAPTAPALPGAAPQVKSSDALPGMPDGPTLRQLEVIQRKVAVIKAKKSFREQERQQNEAEVQDAPPVPMVRGPNGQMIPANLVPPPPTPQERMADYRVLSTVTFGGKASADIANGGLVTTVKMGDPLGPGRVTSIMDGGVVKVSLTTMTQPPKAKSKDRRQRGAPAVGEIRTVTIDLQRAYDGMSAGDVQNSIPSIPGMVQGGISGVPSPRIMPRQPQGVSSLPAGIGQPYSPSFSADATTVPIIGQTAPMPGTPSPAPNLGAQ